MTGKFFTFIMVALILGGCAPQIKKPIQICPGKTSVSEALRSVSQNTTPLKANGQCLLRYYADGKKHKENFPVKVWGNPPAEIYLQGDLAFDPRAIVLGSNENEFWLIMKPKEISSYWWGKWSEQNSFGKLNIEPKILLEALGIAQGDSEGDWSLSNEEAFDVLTKRNGQGAIIKKIYVNCCDYLVRKIEYFNANGETEVVTELEYKRSFKGFSIPNIIKIATYREDEKECSLRITLRSVKTYNFTKKKQNVFFTRPVPIVSLIFRIIGGEIVEEP